MAGKEKRSPKRDLVGGQEYKGLRLSDRRARLWIRKTQMLGKLVRSTVTLNFDITDVACDLGWGDGGIRVGA